MAGLNLISRIFEDHTDIKNMIRPICSLRDLPNMQLWLLENKLWLVNTHGEVPYQSNPINTTLIKNAVNCSVQELPRREILPQDVCRLQEKQELTWGNTSYYVYIDNHWQQRWQSQQQGQKVFYDYIIYHRIFSASELNTSEFLRECQQNHLKMEKNRQMVIKGMGIFFIMLLGYLLFLFLHDILGFIRF